MSDLFSELVERRHLTERDLAEARAKESEWRATAESHERALVDLTTAIEALSQPPEDLLAESKFAIEPAEMASPDRQILWGNGEWAQGEPTPEPVDP